MNGPAGDLPLLLWHDGAPQRALRAGAGAGRGLGRRAIARWDSSSCPGRAISPPACPGAFDAWMLLLRDFGTFEFADVAAVRDRLRALRVPRDARDRARDRGARAVAGRRPRRVWGRFPRSARGCANPLLADTYERLTRSGGAHARGADRRRARRLLPRLRRRGDRRRGASPGAGRSGSPHAGVLTGDDLAAFSATLEAPASLGLPRLDGVQDRAVGPGAGLPAAARAARRARARAVPRRRARPLACSSARSSRSPTARRSTATRRRCRWSGCSRPGYATARRALVGDEASGELRPGRGGQLPSVRTGAARGRGRRRADARRHLPPRRRRPLRQPRLRDAERRLAAELARDAGPRLLPRHAGADVLARGGPAGVAWWAGGGRARRCRLRWRCATTGRCWRSARPAATSRTSGRWSSSSRTRSTGATCRRRSTRRCSTRRTSRARSTRARPSRGGSRSRAGCRRTTIAALRERGHDVVLVDDWSLGRLSAVSRAPDGVLRGAANPRGMQGYAVGR